MTGLLLVSLFYDWTITSITVYQQMRSFSLQISYPHISRVTKIVSRVNRMRKAGGKDLRESPCYCGYGISNTVTTYYCIVIVTLTIRTVLVNTMNKAAVKDFRGS